MLSQSHAESVTGRLACALKDIHHISTQHSRYRRAITVSHTPHHLGILLLEKHSNTAMPLTQNYTNIQNLQKNEHKGKAYRIEKSAKLRRNFPLHLQQACIKHTSHSNLLLINICRTNGTRSTMKSIERRYVAVFMQFREQIFLFELNPFQCGSEEH